MSTTNLPPAPPVRVLETDSGVSSPDPPMAFVCPITSEVMEDPHSTVLGHTYEKRAIEEWLVDHDTDPATNESLPSKLLIPNFALKSQIQGWADAQPVSEPEDGYSRLGDVLEFRATTKRGKGSAQAIHTSVVSSEGHVYETRLAPQEGGPPLAEVRVDGGAWHRAQDRKATGVFVQPEGAGVVLFNPREFHDARVTAQGPVCSFGAKCTRASCTFAHPFVCPHGYSCKAKATTCHLVHPPTKSVVPLGPEYPQNTVCRFGTSCSNAKCHFAHPKGRVSVPREPKQIRATLDEYTLEALPQPVALPLPMPPKANRFLFQGEFAFFLEAYPGAWGRDYAKTVTVARWSSEAGRHVVVGNYSLDGHYCNTAVGRDRFFAISWWPYSEEGVRRDHEAGIEARHMEKSLASAQREIEQKEKKLSKQAGALRTEQKRGAAQQAKLDAKDQHIATQQAKLGAKEKRIAAQQAKLTAKDKHIAQQQEALQGMQRKLQQQQQRERQRQREEKQRRQQEKEEKKRQWEERQLQREEKQRQWEERQRQREEKQHQWEERQRQREEKQRQWEERQRQREEKQRQWEERQRRQASARSARSFFKSQRTERWRMQDPIHLYALEADSSGDRAENWRLILDYHKGAHELDITPPRAEDGLQRLLVTEEDKVMEFALTAPERLADLDGELPIVPSKLCDDF